MIASRLQVAEPDRVVAAAQRHIRQRSSVIAHIDHAIEPNVVGDALHGPRGHASSGIEAHSPHIDVFDEARESDTAAARENRAWFDRRAEGQSLGMTCDGCVVNTVSTEIAPAFYANDDLGLSTIYFGGGRTGSLDYDIYETTTTDEDLESAVWVPACSFRNSAALDAIPAHS